MKWKLKDSKNDDVILFTFFIEGENYCQEHSWPVSLIEPLPNGLYKVNITKAKKGEKDAGSEKL